MLIITDGDYEKEEVADDDRGDHVRWSCVFVHDCNITDYFASLQRIILFPVKVSQGVSIISEVALQRVRKKQCSL